MKKTISSLIALFLVTILFSGCDDRKGSQTGKITGKSLLPSDISSSINRTQKSFVQFETIAGAMITFDILQEKVPDNYLKEVGFEINDVYETNPEISGDGDLYICYGKNTNVDDAALKKAVNAQSTSDDNSVAIGKEAMDKHACMLFYTYNDRSNFSISFSQKDDAEDFLAQVREYDYKLEVKKGNLLLPEKKADKASLIKVAHTAQIDEDESFSLQFSDKIQKDKDGWYYIKAVITNC